MRPCSLTWPLADDAAAGLGQEVRPADRLLLVGAADLVAAQDQLVLRPAEVLGRQREQRLLGVLRRLVGDDGVDARGAHAADAGVELDARPWSRYSKRMRSRARPAAPRRRPGAASCRCRCPGRRSACRGRRGRPGCSVICSVPSPPPAPRSPIATPRPTLAASGSW